MATQYGAGGIIYVAEAYSGSAGSETPDTTTAGKKYWIFYTPDLSGQYESMMKIKQLAGGSSYSNKDGKRNWGVDLKDCYVVKNTGATPTAEFNLIFNWWKDQTKAGAAQSYLFAKNEVDNTYLQLGAIAAVTTKNNYLKGYWTRAPWKESAGNLYKFDIHFQECL